MTSKVKKKPAKVRVSGGVKNKPYWHKAGIFVIVFAVIGGLVILRTFASPDDHALFHCGKRDANVEAPPTITPIAPDGSAITASAERPSSPCPSGQVPRAVQIHEDQRPGKFHERKNEEQLREQAGSTYYSYATMSQDFSGNGIGVYGFFIDQTNETPSFPTRTGHTDTQLWLQDRTDPRGYSTLEVGWGVIPSQFGDKNPHLVIYHFDAGNGMGFAPNTGWVQVSSTVYPNMRVVASDGGKPHRYGVLKSGNNWWVSYDNTWVGYYTPAGYPLHVPTNITRVEAGGEVGTPEFSTCVDMGKGLLGTNTNAAKVIDMFYYVPSGIVYPSSAYTFVSDPSKYTIGNITASQGRFTYGGPGWC